MNDRDTGLAHYMPDEVSEGELDRQWQRLERSARHPFQQARASRFVTTAVLVLAAAAAVGLALLWTRPPDPLHDALLSTTATGKQRLRLGDGSVLELGAATQVKLLEIEARSVAVQVENGVVDFAVTPLPSRTFRVIARGYQVVVVGTHFRVRVSDDQPSVSVFVSSGAVQVQSVDGSTVSTLTAGHSWASASSESFGKEPIARSHPSAGAWTDVHEHAPSGAASDELAPKDATKPKAGPSPTRESEISSKGKQEPEAGPKQMLEAGPKQMLEAAEQARLQGRPAEAAQLLDALRRRYPGDSRAALAAFELGRLRLDTLGDSAGALSALDDALRLAPQAAFAEDAEARRVQALNNIEPNERCRAARARYLQRFPSGVHAQQVTKLCELR